MKKINMWMMLVSVNLFMQGDAGGQCHRLKSILYGHSMINVSVYYCCRHFELKAGHCAACARGYTSNGTRCEPCPNERYGERCGDKCSCKTEQRCDHIEGCVLDKNAKINVESLHHIYAPIIATLLLVYFISAIGLVAFRRHTRCISTHENPATISPAADQIEAPYHYIDENMIDLVVSQAQTHVEMSSNLSTKSHENAVISTNNDTVQSTLDDDGYLIPSNNDNVSNQIQRLTMSNDSNENSYELIQSVEVPNQI